MTTLPISMPYVFANVTTTQRLAYLDADFATLTNAINGIGNGSVALANVHITGGNVAPTSNSVPLSAIQATGALTSQHYLRGDGTWSGIASPEGGTVTSVDVNGGTTGFTFTGGPIDVSGNITMSGTYTGNVSTSQLTGTIPTSQLTGTIPTSQLSGTVSAANGGTGLASPGTSGNVLTSTGSAWISSAPASSGGTQNFQWFFSSGTFTVPAGATEIYVAIWGGGGGNEGGGNGGSGGFGQGIYNVTSGTSYTVTIGSGGIGKSAGAGLGTNGGTSSFGSLITCTGGSAAGTDGTASATTSAIQVTGPSSTKIWIIQTIGLPGVTSLLTPLQWGFTQNSGGTASPIAASFSSFPGAGGGVYQPTSNGWGGTGGAAYVQWA
jgi:hypothetical protein